MKCFSCGVENQADVNFCIQCGANLKQNNSGNSRIDYVANTIEIKKPLTIPQDNFLSTQNLSNYWYCPRDRTKMIHAQHRYVNNSVFWVSRNNLTTSIQNAVAVYKLPEYAVNQAVDLAKNMFAHLTIDDIELVGVECPTCKLGAAAPNLKRIDPIGGNYGAVLFHDTKLKEFVQNKPYYSPNEPLKPSIFLWAVIIAYSLLGSIFVYYTFAEKFIDIQLTVFSLSLGLLIMLTAYGLLKLNNSSRYIAIAIAIFFGWVAISFFNLLAFGIVAFSLYVLTYDKKSVFLFKEQDRRKNMSISHY